MTHKLTIQVAAKHATSAYENSFDQWIRRGNIRVDGLVRLSFLVALATMARLIRRTSVQAGRPITTKLSPTGKTVLCRNSLWGKDFEGVCKFGESGEPGEALAAT